MLVFDCFRDTNYRVISPEHGARIIGWQEISIPPSRGELAWGSFVIWLEENSHAYSLRPV